MEMQRERKWFANQKSPNVGRILPAHLVSEDLLKAGIFFIRCRDISVSQPSLSIQKLYNPIGWRRIWAQISLRLFSGGKGGS